MSAPSPSSPSESTATPTAHDFRGIDSCACLGPNVTHNARGQTYVTDAITGEQIDYWSDTEDYVADLARIRRDDDAFLAAHANDWPNYDTAPLPQAAPTNPDQQQ